MFSQSESYRYNSLGQLAAKTDYNGSLFGYQYDESGRLRILSYSALAGNHSASIGNQRDKQIQAKKNRPLIGLFSHLCGQL
ncbi:RHS repeat domain-containing protein [Paenibacillus sp. MMS20-IR301]|uniref:RHS repeat domain-containing protein n=1 Tax=Paenibacillus sp. MMS20-IR301 TaxID=2895946 RepID=UPI0037CA9A38